MRQNKLGVAAAALSLVVPVVAVAGPVPVAHASSPGSADRLSSAADEARYRQQPLFYFGGFAIYPWVLARLVGGAALVAAAIGGIVAAAKAGGSGSSA
ncbi:hypothetical protein JKI95_05400 [Corynebacterium aquatimens]|uniref:hypothetical protein n=1 Tax=Corynebacterium TaxID=1716 RepID=UPI001F18598B|nr:MULTISPECIES: hypothetical protein [Corynebacterium]QYH20326.1 hypothetical protein JKI95_05400 [Corynebacterium aquatimens]UIZ92401.1 hypothetical protein JZY91_00870 [Corynebacterium sp. CNCTC7651]